MLIFIVNFVKDKSDEAEMAKSFKTLDLNGDGRRDVLWKHSDGSVQAWLMNGLTISQIARLAAAGSYEVVPARQ